MFVSIDMQNLEFLHKHYKTSVLFNLAHVEVPKSFVVILTLCLLLMWTKANLNCRLV